MSESGWATLGTCADDWDDRVEVGRLGGKVTVTFGDSGAGDHRSMHFGPERFAQFRELLGRAAGARVPAADVSRERLAAAIETVRRAHSETEESCRAQGRYMVGADQLAGELLAELPGRAAMPGQAGRAAIAHVATDPDAHRRHGCPTCLAGPARAETPGVSGRG